VQNEKPRKLSDRTIDYGLAFRRPSAEVSQRPTASDQQPVEEVAPSLFHWPLTAGCWLLRHFARSASNVHKLRLAQKELKESRVWLLFASRLVPGDEVEALRSESRELLLMIGKSINTAVARNQSKSIGA